MNNNGQKDGNTHGPLFMASTWGPILNNLEFTIDGLFGREMDETFPLL